MNNINDVKVSEFDTQENGYNKTQVDSAILFMIEYNENIQKQLEICSSELSYYKSEYKSLIKKLNNLKQIIGNVDISKDIETSTWKNKVNVEVIDEYVTLAKKGVDKVVNFTKKQIDNLTNNNEEDDNK